MLNDLMWVLVGHLALAFTFFVAMIALVWVTNVIVKALKHGHARVTDALAPLRSHSVVS